MTTIQVTIDNLIDDIDALHSRGYDAALDALPLLAPGQKYTLQQCFAALRAAGYTDDEINSRDYSRTI